jgi:hypothetical protein
MFTTTSTGSIFILPNPDLKPETGNNFEIGLKQGISLGNKKVGIFNTYIDFSIFQNKYQNMMEYSFGSWFIGDFGSFKSVNMGSTTIQGFEIESVKLKITTDPGGPNEKVENSLTIEPSFEGYGTQWALTPTGLVLTPNSLYLEKIIIENIFKGDVLNQDLRMKALPLIAGGWSGSPVVGYNGIAVKYDWTISFKFNNVKQKTGIYFEYSGILEEACKEMVWAARNF